MYPNSLNPSHQRHPVHGSGSLVTRVILAGDHAILRQGLAALLRTQPDVAIIDQVADGESAWQSICNHRPDIAILDLALPKANGTEVVRRVLTAALNTRCLLLTLPDDPGAALEARQAGAAGFVRRRDGFEDLMLALRTIALGGSFVSPSIQAELCALQRSGQHPVALSPREQEIVRLLATGKSGKEIARRLAIGPRTVDTHRRRLMEKLGMHSVKEVVRYAVQRGLVD